MVSVGGGVYTKYDLLHQHRQRSRVRWNGTVGHDKVAARHASIQRHE